MILNAVIGNMITMDPPGHRNYRNIAKPYFSNRSVNALRERVQELARGIVADAVRKFLGPGPRFYSAIYAASEAFFAVRCRLPDESTHEHFQA